MGVVDQPIEDCVGEGRFVDDIVPCLDRKLAGDDRRSCAVSILDDFHEVAPLAGGEPVWPPIVQDQQVRLHELSEQPGKATIAMGEFEIGEEARQAERMTKPIIYWVRRDFRLADNAALLAASILAQTDAGLDARLTAWREALTASVPESVED